MCERLRVVNAQFCYYAMFSYRLEFQHVAEVEFRISNREMDLGILVLRQHLPIFNPINWIIGGLVQMRMLLVKKERK